MIEVHHRDEIDSDSGDEERVHARFARLVARPVDRVHIAGSRLPDRNVLTDLTGSAVPPVRVAWLAPFMARAGMSFDEFCVPLRYMPTGRVHELVAGAVEARALTVEGEALAYTADGMAAAISVHDARSTAVAELWSNTPAAVEGLLRLLAPAADAARRTGEPSSRLVDRAVTAERPSAAYELWRELACIRRHRADCHARAWAEAGHTAESIHALPNDADERQSIENRTDELNASIWSAATDEDRLLVLSALASLDGSGTPT